MSLNRWWRLRERWAAAALLVLPTGPASACQGTFDLIFFSRVPPAVRAAPVIARVKILDVEAKGGPERGRWSAAVAHARVLAPLRGVRFAQTISILAVETSCGGGMGRGAIGVEGFVAGEIGPDGLFRGTWSSAQLGHDWFDYALRRPPFAGIPTRIIREAWRGEPNRR